MLYTLIDILNEKLKLLINDGSSQSLAIKIKLRHQKFEGNILQ